ncbi:MAG TPA: trypsin-like peptidase domain-containing protein [Gemmatimonadaceae bacterium]|nr:trypsin-like peptidase domain-containing protein [Gemmatimonadaceae bacterium]
MPHRIAPLAVLLAVLSLASGCRNSNAAQQQQDSLAARRQIREQLGEVPATVNPEVARALSNAFRAAADRALHAVVQVNVEEAARVAERQIPEEYRRFFGGAQQLPMPPQMGMGSGVIFDADGRIMTNYHVVADADRVRVRLVDGREYTAQLLGADSNTDIAVIKIASTRGETFPAVTFGNSDSLRVGDWVLALGSPLGLDFTVTAGIVSARGRQLSERPGALESFIQTDAAINPGNSGGPLVDLFGQMVGVNAAIAGGPRFVGYGFAVPVNLARRVVGDLIAYGYVRRPRLGISVSNVAAVDAEAYHLDRVAGAQIRTVEPGSPAARAGLQVGDVVVALDGRPVENATTLTTQLAQHKPGDRVRLTIIRGGQRRDVTVELAEFPHPRDMRARAPSPDTTGTRLGFAIAPLTPELAQRLGLRAGQGVVVTDVVPYGAAANAGIRPGQILLRINDQEVKEPRDVARIVSRLTPGQVASVRVRDPQIGETIINYRVGEPR